MKTTLLRSATSIAIVAAAMGIMPAVSPMAAQAQDTAELQEKRIPAGEFVKQPNMRTVRISPDGKRLAYTASVNGESYLVTLNMETNELKPVLASSEAREAGERQMAGYRWIGNNHIVITTISRENINGQLGDFRRLIAYDVNTGEVIPQAWDRAGGDAGIIKYIDHKKGTFLLQRDALQEVRSRYGLPEIVEVDVTTGKFKMVQRTNPEVTDWNVDGKGEVRAASSYDRDNGKVRVMFKAEGERNLKTVFNEADETFTDSAPNPSMYIPGTNLVYTLSNHEGYSAVYKMDMTTLDIVEKVYGTEGYDVQGLILNEERDRILGYEVFDGEAKTVFVDPDMKTVRTMLSEVFEGAALQIVDYTSDLKKFVVYVGGINKFPGYFLFDTQTGSLNLLNWEKTHLKDLEANPMKAEWYTASDGVRIQAVVTYPRHREGQKNLPVIVMPHGGPFGVSDRVEIGFFPWHQALAEQGYVVIQPNYRGSGGYGKEFVKMGRQPGGYGKRMQDDLNDAVTAFAEKGVIDANRACIMGWSYGGYAAARGAQRDGDLWKCAVAGAGVYDMPLMNDWDARNLGRFSSGFQATSEDPEGISPARNPEGKWSPILIVAAERDARIPMEQAETLVSALRGAGKVEGEDFRYVIQEQGTHNLPYDDVHMEWINEANAWMQKYNPAYIDTDGDSPPATVAFNN
ncbi:hypothetical protein EH31_07390 [Erythrobacter longus]|uniref:Peptidase S9 prolyl oligopeptidase catalytic domain-containing protein n=1 Tax=Erythrobacter longus TaxID=1044 RepID=A0A074MG72_ERYLO|nr:prolyl oligopeptidase family serine peptidase [Erythrobacter longus]KEO90853.1 hypothetical protein EH31_07390 [Erythrobacter longus]